MKRAPQQHQHGRNICKNAYAYIIIYTFVYRRQLPPSICTGLRRKTNVPAPTKCQYWHRMLTRKFPYTITTIGV